MWNFLWLPATVGPFLLSEKHVDSEGDQIDAENEKDLLPGLFDI